MADEKQEQFGLIYRPLPLRWREVGQAAYLFYTYLCTYRNKADNKLINLPKWKKIAEEFDVKPNVVSMWLKSLTQADWILEDENGDFWAVAGFEKEVKSSNKLNFSGDSAEESSNDLNKSSNKLNKSSNHLNSHNKESFQTSNNQKESQESNDSFDKEKINKKKIGSRIPKDFALSAEMRDWAGDKFPTVDVDHETENFLDYWRSKAGKNAVKMDWEATWRTWIRNQFTWSKGKISPQLAGKVNGNGTIQQNSKHNHAGESNGNGKKTNSEILKSRDYSKWEGFDPTEVFAEKS
jgi:hypothetical protein